MSSDKQSLKIITMCFEHAMNYIILHTQNAI